MRLFSVFQLGSSCLALLTIACGTLTLPAFAEEPGGPPRLTLTPPFNEEAESAKYNTISAGALLFNASWAVTAAFSGPDVKVDKTLLIPLAGPWLDLAMRECGDAPGKPSCKHKFVNGLGLVVSGAIQAGSLALFIKGILMPGGNAAPREVSDSHTKESQVSFSPSSPDGTGVGATVAGTFGFF